MEVHYKNKIMAFKGDHEPVQVYKGDELIKNISYVEDVVQGTTSVTYQSEYKKNLLNMSFEGNTFQQTYKGYNVLISPSDLSYKLNDNYINYDISTQIYDINFVDSGKSQSICHFDTPIPSGTKFTLLAEVLNDDFEISEGAGTLVLGLYKKDNTGSAWAGSVCSLSGLTTNKVITQTAITTQPTTDIWLFRNSSSTSYTKNLQVRFLVYFGEQTITEWQPYVGGIPSPNPSYPQPIQNIGDNVLKCVLRGKNLHYIENRQYTFTNKYYSSVSTGFELSPNTTYTLSFDYEFMSINKTQGTRWGLGRGDTFYKNDIIYSNSFPNFTKGRTSCTFTTPANLGTATKLHLRIPRNDGGGLTGEMTVSNFMINYGKETPYEPYFEPKSVIAPVTLCGIGDYKDTLIADWTDKTVKKHKEIELYTFTGNEEITSLADGIAVKLPQTAYPSSSELPYGQRCYCTHFIWSGENNRANNSIECDYDYMYLNRPDNFNEDTFRVFLSDNYMNGTPVQIAYVLYDEYTEDTDTDLLELTDYTQNQTNIIEITSDLEPSALNVTYAKWGGAENENQS